MAPLNVILQYDILLCIVYLLLVIFKGSNHLVALFYKKRQINKFQMVVTQ
jgi:hypothetical protein